MPDRRRLAGSLQALRHVPDRIVALRMDHHEGAFAPREIEHVEELTVGQDHVIIGHEDLERGVAVLDEGRQFLTQHGRCRIRDDEMERRIDMALPLGERPVGLDLGPQALALLLHREGHHAGVAAGRSRPGGRVEIVRHHDAGSGILRDVDMAVDAARQDQKAAGVDLARSTRQAVRHRHDAAAPDTDIGPERIGRGDHRAAPDGEVEFRHRRSPLFVIARQRHGPCRRPWRSQPDKVRRARKRWAARPPTTSSCRAWRGSRDPTLA